MARTHTINAALMGAFTLACLSATPAASQTRQPGRIQPLPNLQEVIDKRTHDTALAYQSGDHSMHTAIEVMRNANDGDGFSGRVLGDACMFSDYCPEGRAKAVARLENADRAGDQGASYSLGQAYYYGMHDGSAKRNTERAIYWLVKAAKGGQTAAHFQLQQLPRLDVMTAGGGDYLQALPTIAPAPKIAPTTMPKQTKSDYQQLNTPGGYVFAGTKYPKHPIVSLSNLSTMPIVIDTELSVLGDAAAGCSSVATEHANKIGAPLHDNTLSLTARIATAKQFKKVMVTVNLTKNILGDKHLNGNLMPADADSLIAWHVMGAKRRPDLAPSFAECETLLPILQAEKSETGTRQLNDISRLLGVPIPPLDGK